MSDFELFDDPPEKEVQKKKEATKPPTPKKEVKVRAIIGGGYCQIAAFGVLSGEQIGELQKSALELFCEHAIRKGYNPENFQILFANADKHVVPVKRENGWSWAEEV